MLKEPNSRSLEDLRYEIEQYEIRMTQLILLPIFGDKHNSTEEDYEWDDRLSEFIEGVYKEYNLKCDETTTTDCYHCDTQFSHRMSHEMVADFEGWETDHHNMMSEMGWDGCSLCPPDCDMGDCSEREFVASEEWRNHAKSYIIDWRDEV